ncbi:MAG: hypothetical protein II306_10320 [Clostridia bacterium]|nr:hypothetical protein [Clostridia bacterium]MEE1023761.1 hypothetical protein [Acutalibacteraceae bacterium]
MNIKAIVYTSNTGYTKEYAELLSKKSGLPMYSLNEANKALSKDTEIIYLGWLMASILKGYKKAAKRYKIAAVCGVCLGSTGSQLDSVSKSNAFPKNLPIFTLQGGYNKAKLRGVYKFMMGIVEKSLIKQISEKEIQTEDDKVILNMLQNGGSAVSEENLKDIFALMAL